MAPRTSVTRQQVAETQQELSKQALAQLAVIGGKMTRDEEVTYQGKAFVFPEQFRGQLNDLLRYVQRYVEGQQEEIVVQRTFNYRPLDGAHAVYNCLRDFFGYAQSKARMGMFGKVPPNEVDISLGFIEGVEQRMSVPFGSDMVLPGMTNATLTITQQMDSERGWLLHLVTRCRRVEKEIIEGFYKVVDDYLRENSIYKGKAVYGNMDFLDTDKIDPEQFVYTEQVWADAGTLIFSPMRDAAILNAKGLEKKRVLLLEGPYGTGKSGLGRTSAKVAVSNGWTAIIARPGLDDPFEVLKTARLYQPALVFVEDVDTIASRQDANYVTKLLDAFDGFGTKDLQMMLVLTTNHVEDIHKGMLRPGRIHGIISIGAMDRPGLEKLCKIVVGTDLEDDIDFDKVYEAGQGFMPAFIREGLERAVRYSIARLGKIGKINTDDLVHALGSLRAQQELQDRANDKKPELPALDSILRSYIQNGIDPDALRDIVDGVVENRIDGAALFKPDGSHLANVVTA